MIKTILLLMTDPKTIGYSIKRYFEMGDKRKYKYFACDFETTVYEGQRNTEVWASAAVELGTEDVHIWHSIEETYQWFIKQRCNCVLYYHNLKFDGNFWIWYIMHELKYKTAIHKTGPDMDQFEWRKNKDMYSSTFKYSISHMGQWYTITIKYDKYILEMRDSLKLLPFSLAEIGKAFNTKHQKLSMEYEGFRYAGCEITEEEKKYIANDVLVLKEALEFMFSEGHDKLTIGACCMSEYKLIFGKDPFDYYFPRLENQYFNDPDKYEARTVDDYIRRAYRGGWCYLVPEKAGRITGPGCTADVNSLYPSMMSSESGNRYPVGFPEFWKGNYIPDEAKTNNRYYFVRFRTRFYLKPGYLPFVQIKGSLFYRGTENLTDSDVIVDKKTGEKSAWYIDFYGKIQPARPILTMTCTDFDLFLEHYDVQDFEILDGCYFETKIGVFDEYIAKYKKMKLENKGAKRTLAKLFLNNLYGKMASNTDSSFKCAYLKEDETIGFFTVMENNKTAGFIPVGAAITSYARNFTIRAAQKNYHGPNKPGFIYADTDSIHCDLPEEKLKGVPIHDKNFCCWKIESHWIRGLFVRQKTYIEQITQEDGEDLEKPYYNIKCAGMNKHCKQLFNRNLEGAAPEPEDSDAAREFLKVPRTMEDFKIGLKVPGKLMPRRIKGGVVLVSTDFEIRA